MNYAEYGVVMTSPPPVILTNTVLYAFVIDVGIINPMRVLCQKVFDHVSDPGDGNKPAVQCEPAGHNIYLQFSHTESINNAVFPTGVGETEVLIHIPVDYTVGKKKGSAWFTPYIWTNNSLSMGGGREVFGFPKALGKVEIDKEPVPDSLQLISLCANFFDKYMTQQYLIKVTRKGPIDPPDNVFAQILYQYELQQNLEQHDQQQEENAPDLAFNSTFVDLVGTWLTKGKRKELFLKQFRDGTGYGKACFQEIATATYTAKPPTSEPIEEAYALEVLDVGSAPLRTDIGLTSRELKPGGVRSVVGKLILSPAEVLWQGH